MPEKIFTHVNRPPEPAAGGAPPAGRKVAIQSGISVREWRTEAGSRALKGFIPLENAAVVNRLLQSGFYLAGSTKMSEFGFGIRGDRSAKAVSGGHADMALMTDALGEARMAAALDGLFGFKPSYGIVSRFGLIGLVPSMESFGIIARTPGEIVSLLDAIAVPDEQDFSMSENGLSLSDANSENVEPSGTVLGIVGNCFELLKKEDADCFQEHRRSLARSGWTIREVDLPDFDLFSIIHNVIGSVEASSSCGKFDGVRYGHRTPGTKNWNDMYIKSRGESFGLLMKSYLMQGAYFQFENYAAFEDACRIRARLLEETRKLLGEADLLILPTRRCNFPAESAQTVAETYGAFCFTLLANVVGLPALHLPLGQKGGRFDPGLQLVGPHLDDRRLLAAAGRMAEFGEGRN